MTSEHQIHVSETLGSVHGLLLRPSDARGLFVFGHGAGAGMRHSFMERCVEELAGRGVATLRYNFPYMEAGRRAPNRPPALLATVRAAVAEAGRISPDLPLFAGGKSMGGRMTSTAASTEPLEGVRGLAFFGFPLHAAGRDSVERGEHLGQVELPMLFLQGTRDRLANLDLLRPLLEELESRPRLHVVDGADHGFHVLKRSGRTDDDVLAEITDAFAVWMDEVLSR